MQHNKTVSSISGFVDRAIDSVFCISFWKKIRFIIKKSDKIYKLSRINFRID